MVMRAFDPSIQVTEGPGLLEFKAHWATELNGLTINQTAESAPVGAFKRWWFDGKGSAPLSTLAYVWITGSGPLAAVDLLGKPPWLRLRPAPALHGTPSALPRPSRKAFPICKRRP